MSVGGIRRSLGLGELAVELINWQVLSRCVSLFTLEQMSGSLDPWRTEVRSKIRSVSHHVVVSDIEIVFDIQPFAVGEDVAEGGVTRGYRLVSAELGVLDLIYDSARC